MGTHKYAADTELSANQKLIIFICIAIPSSFVFWICNIILNSMFGVEIINIIRWLSACMIPCIFSVWGLKKNSLSNSGAIAGLFVGFLVTLSSYAFLACLVVFFVSSSKATKFRSYMKRKIEKDFEEGGKRNWIQVLSNGLVASAVALLYILDCGCGEQIVDTKHNYRCAWLSYAFIGAFSCCNGDTWASELGPVMKFGNPYLLTTLQPVPKGTNGGVSFTGLLASFFGGAVVGLGFLVSLYLTIPSKVMGAAPSQWPVVIYSGIGGFGGSLIDSFLGATLQYSGIDEDGSITDIPGTYVKHISGRPILNNHLINFFSSLIVALLLPGLVMIST